MKMILFKMKWVLILFCGSVCFQACSDEKSVVDYKEDKSPYDRMGRLHNEGLDYVLEKIVSTSPLTKGGGRKIPGRAEIRKICCDFACTRGLQVTTKQGRGNQDTIQDFSFLSENQLKWLDRTKKMIENLPLEAVEEFPEKITILEKELLQDEEMTDAEKEILLHMLAVCRYSAQYWMENYEKWQIELYGVQTLPIRKTRTRSEKEVPVTLEWWEKYKTIVWGDGSSGIRCDGYYLVDATYGSVSQCIK